MKSLRGGRGCSCLMIYTSMTQLQACWCSFWCKQLNHKQSRALTVVEQQGFMDCNNDTAANLVVLLVAGLVEQRTSNPQIRCSSPGLLAALSRGLSRKRLQVSALPRQWIRLFNGLTV